MQGKTVLIVHDDQRLAELISGVLQEAGLHALQSSDLSDAASTFRYFEPDLVVVDLKPLRQASPDAKQMLRGADSARRIPVLALVSARDDDISLENLGAVGTLHVPLKSVDVLETVRRHLVPTAAESLSGQLDRVGITDILTMFDMGKRSGRVKLDDGRRQAWVQLVDGDVTDGGIDGKAIGPDVINELLNWKKGTFKVSFGEAPAKAETASSAKPEEDDGAGLLLSTNEVSLAGDDRDFLRRLLPKTEATTPEAAPAASANAEPEPAEPSVSDSDLAAHQALTLLNAVASYASGFCEQRLLQRKLDGVRQRLVRTYSALEAFEVSLDASVGLREKSGAENLGKRSIVESCSEWLIAFALELDRTFPGSMPRATLHILAESVISREDPFSFMKALGFGGGGRQAWS